MTMAQYSFEDLHDGDWDVGEDHLSLDPNKACIQVGSKSVGSSNLANQPALNSMGDTFSKSRPKFLKPPEPDELSGFDDFMCSSDEEDDDFYLYTSSSATKGKTSQRNYQTTEGNKKIKQESLLTSLQNAHPDVPISLLEKMVELHMEEQCKAKLAVEDKKLLEKVKHLYKSGKWNWHELNKLLFDGFTSSRNPYLSALFLFQNLEEGAPKKNGVLLQRMLSCFESWLKQHSLSHLLNDDIKIEALTAVTRTPNHFAAFDIINRVFSLYSLKKSHIVACVKPYIFNKKYNLAAYCISKLGIQDDFQFEDVLLPLLLQDKINLIESYVNGKKKWQRKLVIYLDGLCDQETNIQKLVFSSDVPNIQMHKIKPKVIEKLVVRLMKKYKLPWETCINVYHKKLYRALNHLLYRKYIQKDIGCTDWDDIIKDFVGSNNFLQEELVDKLVSYFDVDDAAHWANQFNLSEDKIPHQVILPLRELSVKTRCIRKTVNPIDWTDIKEDWGDIFCHTLKLPYECVILVETKLGFQDCINRLSKKGGQIGFDCEWKPTFQEEQSKLALLQMATWHEVFLLDIPALLNTLDEKDWHMLASHVFNDSTILKIGYSLQDDIERLIRTVPTLHGIMHNAQKMYDLEDIHGQVVKNEQNIQEEDLASEFAPKKKCRGLSDLVMKVVGKPLDKSQQISNWERRPLRRAQMNYAALDAFVLLEIYQHIHPHDR